MRKSRFTESQIVSILKDGDAGLPLAELVRKHGISRATYFNWKSKYAGATVADLKRMKELEARGMVERNVISGPPLRVEYELSQMGRELEPALSELQRWANRWLSRRTPARV